MSDDIYVSITDENETVSIEDRQDVFVSLEPETETFADCILEGDKHVEAAIMEQEPVLVEIKEQIQIIRTSSSQGDMYMTIAATALSGHRVVGVNSEDMAEYASCDNSNDAFKAYGITTHAAEQGAEIEIQMEGEIAEPSWNWNPGDPLFLGLNGVLTQTAPLNPAFYLIIGWAVTSIKIKIRIEEPLLRG